MPGLFVLRKLISSFVRLWPASSFASNWETFVAVSSAAAAVEVEVEVGGDAVAAVLSLEAAAEEAPADAELEELSELILAFTFASISRVEAEVSELIVDISIIIASVCAVAFVISGKRKNSISLLSLLHDLGEIKVFSAKKSKNFAKTYDSYNFFISYCAFAKKLIQYRCSKNVIGMFSFFKFYPLSKQKPRRLILRGFCYFLFFFAKSKIL